MIQHTRFNALKTCTVGLLLVAIMVCSSCAVRYGCGYGISDIQAQKDACSQAAEAGTSVADGTTISWFTEGYACFGE